MPVYPVLCALAIVVIGRGLGLEIFPRVDAGRFQIRMRALTGTRIEETEKLALRVLGTIQDEVGAGDVEISIGYVGLIPSSYPNQCHLPVVGRARGGGAADRAQGGADHGRRGSEGATPRRACTDTAGGAVLVRAGRYCQ